MIKVVWDEGFRRSYKKRIANHQNLKDKFWKAMECFLENPWSPHLRTHKLTGRLDGLWAFSVSFDCRVVFRFINNHEVLLIDIGTHEEIY